jgi:hypothetical protein
MAFGPLFAQRSLGEELANRRAEMKQAIDGIPAQEFMDTPVHEIVEAMVEEYGEDPIALDEALKTMEQREVQLRMDYDPRIAGMRPGQSRMVTGYRVEWFIPFEGHPALLRMKPSQHIAFNAPTADIRESEIVLRWEGVQLDRRQIEAYFERQLEMIRRSFAFVNADLHGWMSQLPNFAQQVVVARRARLEQAKALETAMGVPMRRLDSAPAPLPITRKRSGLKRLAKRPSEPKEQEWTLEQALYEDILEIIQSMGRAFERTPGSFAKFGEEGLRDHILLQLNGTFEGQAGGELFNGNGKTDILVRVKDHTVFIGECKVWSGESDFMKAIGQLLGYLVWRDTKAALVIFITRKDASAVIEKANATLRAHPNYVRDGAASAHPTSRRNYVLHNNDDPDKHIQVAFIPVVLRDTDE